MSHIRYPKIHRLGKSENFGILDREVHVQEKIDGANLSIWWDEGIHVGSRSQDVTNRPGGFNGSVQYVENHKGIVEILNEHPEYHLFGEWLVPHTIKNYKPTAYGHFYLFDILDKETGNWLTQEHVCEIAEKHGIRYPYYFGRGKFSEEELQEFVGKTEIGENGEGIVVKPVEPFENEWGDKNVYAKIVTESFKEDNGVMFGGNNKHSDTYHEMYICNKYMTITRCKKMMNKLSSEGVELDKTCTSRFISQVYHDLVTEECWEIANSGKTINLNALGRICKKKAQVMFHDLLEGNDSVAYA